MSDLLSPLLEMMNSEVDTFWCFVGYMNMVVSGTSFVSASQGIAEFVAGSCLLKADVVNWVLG